MADRYVIRGRYRAEGIERRPGEVVEAADWRWRQNLLDDNKLERVSGGLTPVECECGRRWEDEEVLDRCPGCGGEATTTDDLEGLKKAELQDIADEMGLEPEGTGAQGNVLKDDLKRAIRKARE